MLNLEVIGQGATTKIYRDGNTAIKLYENAPPDEADNEAARQRFARDSGLPVPEIYGIRRLENNAVALDMEYIAGKPVICPGMSSDQRNSAIKAMAELQCQMHKVHAPGLPKLTSRLEWKIRNSQYLDETIKESLLTLLAQLNSEADFLCHGDFHPNNVLYDGFKYWIIDWVDAASGNPYADACRTYLIFLQYLKRSSGIYLKAFCRQSKSKPEDVLVWLPVIATARLRENLDGKSRKWLLDIIQDWHNSRNGENR
jgi:Predicted aminoglycoside phosphotransferase